MDGRKHGWTWALENMSSMGWGDSASTPFDLKSWWLTGRLPKKVCGEHGKIVFSALTEYSTLAVRK